MGNPLKKYPHTHPQATHSKLRSALLFSDASMTYFLPKQNKNHYNGYF